MARVKRWSAALAWISLALAGLAHAEPPRPIELPSSVPVEIALPGLEQAVVADPSIVRADADVGRGVLTLTGLMLSQQSVVYAWTSDGMVVFVAKVVAPPLLPTPRRPASLLAADGRDSLYRVSVGGGFRKTPEETRRLPMVFGGSAYRPVGSDRLTMRGSATPFRDDNPGGDAAGSAMLQWAGERGRVSVGDQPVELGQQLVTNFPLRGVGAEGKLGPATVMLFGGARATPSFTLLPQDKDPLPALLGGAKASLALTDEVKLAGAVAMAETAPVGDLVAEWRHGIWSAALETAGTMERLAAGLRLRRESENLTLEQRLTERTAGESPLMPGVAGLMSESVATYKLTRTVAANARVSVLPPLGRNAWQGAWHLGSDWSGVDGLRVAAGLDRSFDGALTVIGGTVDTLSKRFGNASVTVTRTLQAGPTGNSDVWYEMARAERPVELGPVVRLFAEQSLTQSAQQGSLRAEAGPEVEAGWLRAAIAPGIIVPTLTDPNGIAETLRMRLTVTPSAAFQFVVDVRQTFGAKPDTTVQMGVTVGFGSGSPLGSVGSWFSTSGIEGVVFVDANGNGRRDPGEPGLQGVRIRIDGDKSVVTDGEGRYKFTGLKHGTYTVSLDRGNLPSNLRLASASPVMVTLPNGPREVSFVFAGTGAIHGVIFNDVRLARRFSGSEPGVPANVVLEGPGTRRSLSVTGSFSIGGLAPGRYRLSLDALSLPPAYLVERPELEFEIGAGDVVTAQFPVVALRALDVFACLARRGGSERCEEQDAPLAGLRVSVAGSSVTTDGQGRVLIRDLPAGRVTLTIDSASVPSGWSAPRHVTVELPESPVTQPVPIRLRATAR